MDLTHFNKEFLTKFECFASKVHELNLQLAEIQGYIHPKIQAKLWRQGHNDSEIDAMISSLEEKDCFYLAKLIRDTYSHPGLSCTDAIPGCTWHNWGEALTYHILDEHNHVLELSHPKYLELAKIAKKCGFVHGTTFKENPKVNLIQLSDCQSPTDKWTLKEINDKLMQNRED